MFAKSLNLTELNRIMQLIPAQTLLKPFEHEKHSQNRHKIEVSTFTQIVDIAVLRYITQTEYRFSSKILNSSFKAKVNKRILAE